MKKTSKQVGKYIVKTKDDGSVRWFYKDKLHREDGPAVTLSNGIKGWYINGYLHREDGPAYTDDIAGGMAWYLDGELLREQDWKTKMRQRKLKALGL